MIVTAESVSSDHEELTDKLTDEASPEGGLARPQGSFATDDRNRPGKTLAINTIYNFVSKRQRITLRLLYAIGCLSVVCLSVCLFVVCL